MGWELHIQTPPGTRVATPDAPEGGVVVHSAGGGPVLVVDRNYVYWRGARDLPEVGWQRAPLPEAAVEAASRD